MMFPGAYDSKRERAEDTLDQGLDLLEQGDSTVYRDLIEEVVK